MIRIAIDRNCCCCRLRLKQEQMEGKYMNDSECSPISKQSRSSDRTDHGKRFRGYTQLCVGYERLESLAVAISVRPPMPVYDYARVRSNNPISNANVRQRVLSDGGTGKSLEGAMNLHRLRWLRHVLRMRSDRTVHRVLFAASGAGCIREGDQPITCFSGMKKWTCDLTHVGGS